MVTKKSVKKVVMFDSPVKTNETTENVLTPLDETPETEPFDTSGENARKHLSATEYNQYLAGQQNVNS